MSRTGTPPPSIHHSGKLETSVGGSRGRDSGSPSATGGDPSRAPLDDGAASASRSPRRLGRHFFLLLPPSFHQHLWSGTFFPENS